LVNALDLVVSGIFFLTYVFITIVILVNLFNIQHEPDKPVILSLSTPIIYLFLSVTLIFGLVKFYQYSKFKNKLKKRKNQNA